MLGDLWGSPQKYLSIVGSKIRILKANGGVKEKEMCLKDNYMGGGAMGLEGLAPQLLPNLCKISLFATNFGISMPTAPSHSS